MNKDFNQTLEDLFFKEEEENWRKSNPKLSNNELEDIFGKGCLAEIAREKTKEYIAELNELSAKYSHSLKRIKFLYPKDKLEITLYITDLLFKAAIEELNKKIGVILKILPNNKNWKDKNSSNFIKVDELLERTNIIDFVDREIGGARKSGQGRYLMCCPFHDDSKPSLTLYEHTNSYYCFGCHTGGSIIDFVMRYRNLNFLESLKYLSLLN